MATLLSMCQGALDRVNLTRSTQIVSATDQTARTLLGCAQREGSALARRWAWQAMVKEHTFVSIAAAIQTGSLPADWDGRMVNQTFWNRTQMREVSGPITSQQWQSRQANSTPAITDAYRIRNNLIELSPTPSAGWTYAYEYLTKNWCESAGGTEQSAWAADTDVPMLDAELMTMGIRWRFLSVMGMDFAGAKDDYETEVATSIGRDGSRAIVRLIDDDWNRRWGPLAPSGSWAL